MHIVRKRKLYVIVSFIFVIAIAIALVLYALGQNISLFYNPTQIALGESPLHHIIRVGGMVEKGSVVRKDKLYVEFKLTDFAHTIRVEYQGILPDLFREEQGIVAEGVLMNKHTFKATQVLAKHDANYMPPEVKASLKVKKEQA